MRFYLILISLLIFCGQAWAIKVVPISAQLDLTKKRSHTITVSNPATKAVPVKITVFTWNLDINGKESRTPSQDLRVFPRQFVLKAGQQRQVRVLLRNRNPPRVEKTYRVVISELPVNLDSSKPKNGVFVLIEYATALYVLPRQPQSKVQLRSATRSRTGLVFTLKNTGNAHTHLKKLSLNLQQGGKTVRLTGEDLTGFYNENLHAGKARRFEVNQSVLGGLSWQRALRGTLTFECEHCDNRRPVSLPFSF